MWYLFEFVSSLFSASGGIINLACQLSKEQNIEISRSRNVKYNGGNWKHWRTYVKHWHTLLHVPESILIKVSISRTMMTPPREAPDMHRSEIFAPAYSFYVQLSAIASSPIYAKVSLLSRFSFSQLPKPLLLDAVAYDSLHFSLLWISCSLLKCEGGKNNMCVLFALYKDSCFRNRW